MKKEKIKELSLDVLFIIVSSVLTAIGINMFTAPNDIAPGGFTGIATILNYLYGLPIGAVIFIMNVPFVIWAIMEIGYKLVLKTFFSVLTSSLLTDLLAPFITPYKGDMILVSISAGVILGVGFALVFTREATSGGTDLIAKLLNNRIKFISMGKLLLAIDCLVVLVAAFVYKNIENALYACITGFVCSKIIDSMLMGTDIGNGKLFFIMSEKNDVIAQRIISELDRGVTFLDSMGAYTMKEGKTILCAVRKYQIHKMHRIIKETDKNAFIIATDANEIMGESFKPHFSDDKTLKDIIEKVKGK